jgi:hypothetical protein
MNIRISEQELRSKVEQIMNNQECGNVFRIKGFMQTQKGWIELNATHNNISVSPIKNGQEIIIVIGENLKNDIINSYFA